MLQRISGPVPLRRIIPSVYKSKSPGPVGTLINERPPDRAVHARLRIRLLCRDEWGRCVLWGRGCGTQGDGIRLSKTGVRFSHFFLAVWLRRTRRFCQSRLTRSLKMRNRSMLPGTAWLDQLCRRLCHAVRTQMCRISTLGGQSRVLPCGLVLEASA